MVIQAPDNPNNILVINERGDLKSVPADLAIDLEGSGFVPAEQEHINLLKERDEERKFMETPGQQVASAAMGGLSGITVGLAPWVMGKTLGAIGGEESENAFREWQRLQEEYNPDLKLGGEIAGALLPAALTAGGSLAATGATGAARGASVLNAVGKVAGAGGRALSFTPTGAVVGLGRIAEEAIAKRVGEGLFGTILEKSAGNAIEGIAFGMGTSVSKQYLENDPNLTASAYTLNLLKEGGIGGLVGAAIPTGLYGGTAALKEASKRIIDPLTDTIARTGKETFKKAYRPLAAWRTDSTTKEIDEMLKPLEIHQQVPITMELADGTGSIDATIQTKINNTDTVIKDLFNLSDKETRAMEILKNDHPGWWRAWREEATIKQVGREATRLQTNIANLTEKDINNLVGRFSTEISDQVENIDLLSAEMGEALLKGTGAKAEDFANWSQALSTYSEAVKNLKAEFSIKGSKDINPQKFKSFLKDPYSRANEPSKLVYDNFNEASTNLLRNLGPDVKAAYGWVDKTQVLDSVELNEHITDILAKKAVFDNLPVYVKKELGLGELAAAGASVVGSAGLGLGPIAKAYGAARASQLGKNPAADIAQWARIQQGIQAIKDEVGLFGKHFAMPAAIKITEFGPSVAATTQSLQSSWEAKKRGRKRKEDELAAFRDYMTSLQGLGKEPDVLKSTIDQHLAGLSDLPMSREAAAQQLVIMSDYLAQKLPSLRMTDDIDLDRLTLPSKDELRQFRRMVETINNPLKVVRDMGKGKVTLEGIQTLREVYPRIHQDLVQEIMRLIKEKKIKSPQQKEQARLILGISDSDLGMLQQTFEPEESTSPKGRKMGEGAVKRQIESQQTPLQKIQ